MKKNIYKIISFILIIILILLIGIFTALSNADTQESNNNNNNNDENIDLSISQYDNITLEVYHFHGTAQCVSCVAVGNLAEKTINMYFTQELESGKIKFAHINAELSENSEIVTKYEATGSSIWIGTYLDGQFYKEENTRVWYKINDEEDYMNYLKGEIEKRLNGDLS